MVCSLKFKLIILFEILSVASPMSLSTSNNNNHPLANLELSTSTLVFSKKLPLKVHQHQLNNNNNNNNDDNKNNKIAVKELFDFGGFQKSEIAHLPGHTRKQDYTHPLPHTYVVFRTIPQNFSWGNNKGRSFLTKILNQHIPVYCGSCWAHAALSAFADRIKIARNGTGQDINFSVQAILNCGGEVAGSCRGGLHSGVYDFIKNHQGHAAYDTCQSYAACSSNSPQKLCQAADYTCKKENVCRTCSVRINKSSVETSCSAIEKYPNATIAEYGSVAGEQNMMIEIFTRGPIACSVYDEPLLTYTGGIIYHKVPSSAVTNHVISIVGWGETKKSEKYWICRNSWGEYWGEMGFFRVARGNNHLLIEDNCSWATPKTWSELNFPCYEDGSNCLVEKTYVDPSKR